MHVKKNNVDGSEKYKAWYIAKGYRVLEKTNLASIRVLMSCATHENLKLDGCKNYIPAPYIEQPEGCEGKNR